MLCWKSVQKPKYQLISNPLVQSVKSITESVQSVKSTKSAKSMPDRPVKVKTPKEHPTPQRTAKVVTGETLIDPTKLHGVNHFFFDFLNISTFSVKF